MTAEEELMSWLGETTDPIELNELLGIVDRFVRHRFKSDEAHDEANHALVQRLSDLIQATRQSLFNASYNFATPGLVPPDTRALSIIASRLAEAGPTTLEFAAVANEFIGQLTHIIPIVRKRWLDQGSSLGMTDSHVAEGTEVLDILMGQATLARAFVTDVVLDVVTRAAQEASADAQASAERADVVVSHVEELAGKQATQALEKHFTDFASSQGASMWILRGLGTGLLAVAFLVARAIVFSTEEPLSWDAEVARLALTVPILFLAYYCLREAAHHRDESQQAKGHAVRLQTIRQFTDELPDAEKTQLRVELGRRVFGGSHAAVIGDDSKDAASLLGAITALVGVAKR